MMNILIEQFKNLLNPGTTLGAFLISLGAGCITSFVFGVKQGKHMVYKENDVEVSGKIEGDVFQDVHYPSTNIQNETMQMKTVKSNRIKVSDIKGNISQDCDK